MTWEAILFQLVRWPWVVLGCASAIAGFVSGREFQFRVTPKGQAGRQTLPCAMVLPYCVVALVSAVVAIGLDSAGQARGYYYFCLVNATVYTAAALAIIALHVRENRDCYRWRQAVTLLRGHAALVLALIVLVSAAWSLRGATALGAVFGFAPAPVAGGPSQAAPTAPPVAELPSGVAFGVYDPHGAFAADRRLAIEHVFVPWRLDDVSEIAEAIRRSRERGRVPLVSLEPWPFNWDGLTDETLFADVIGGRYDSSIRRTCAFLGEQSPQEILLRWGHEMELQGVYPWSPSDAGAFVAAYRHVVQTCRQAGAPNVRFVWSPAGDPNRLQAFWPGAEYVDYVGLTTLEYIDWHPHTGTDPLSFTAIFDERYRAVEGYGKPVIVAELGVAGEAPAQREWLRDAARTWPQYPLLKAVVYFNDQNPRIWGDAMTPDWRITPEMFPPEAEASGVE